MSVFSVFDRDTGNISLFTNAYRSRLLGTLQLKWCYWHSVYLNELLDIQPVWVT